MFLFIKFYLYNPHKAKKTKAEPGHHIGVNVWIFSQYSHARNKGFPNSD